MLRLARHLYSRMMRHINAEKDISTVQWIRLIAAVPVLLSTFMIYVQIHPPGRVGSRMDGYTPEWGKASTRASAFSDSPVVQGGTPLDRVQGTPPLLGNTGRVFGAPTTNQQQPTPTPEPEEPLPENCRTITLESVSLRDPPDWKKIDWLEGLKKKWPTILNVARNLFALVGDVLPVISGLPTSPMTSEHAAAVVNGVIDLLDDWPVSTEYSFTVVCH
ncbi:MAG: hypothetical protein CEE40_10315 [Chloroflexi bacterium B3_Chlor]|nr:MAG: hypothetical protein CEE40_10315 [Chloroflexi bacterium B3_Chlor]